MTAKFAFSLKIFELYKIFGFFLPAKYCTCCEHFYTDFYKVCWDLCISVQVGGLSMLMISMSGSSLVSSSLKTWISASSRSLLLPLTQILLGNGHSLPVPARQQHRGLGSLCQPWLGVQCLDVGRWQWGIAPVGRDGHSALVSQPVLCSALPGHCWLCAPMLALCWGCAVPTCSSVIWNSAWKSKMLAECGTTAWMSFCPLTTILQGTRNGVCDGVPDPWQPRCTELVAREVALRKSQLCVVCPCPWIAHPEMAAAVGASLAVRHINILVCT